MNPSIKKEDITANSQGRRDFFKKIVLASLAANLPMAMLSCKDKDAFVGSGKNPYKIWEEMLHYLKTSPDHLQSRMKTLVKEGNPERMYDFVKNEIQLIPLSERSNGDVGKGFKWGLDYALRCGMATPREKAELLTQMLQEAQVPARVMFEYYAVSKEEAQSYFFRQIDRICEPDIPTRVLKKWAKELDLSLDIETEKSSADTEVKMAQDLGKRILKTLNLPEDQYYRPFDFRWNRYETPIVSFEMEGVVKYANLFDPKVPFGELKSKDEKSVKEAKPVKPNTEKVSVTINYRDAIEPLKEKELISGQWLASDLVGRQLGIQFLNNLSLEQQTYTKVGNVNVFTPALTLQAMDESIGFMEEKSVIADPITLSGKRIVLEDNSTKIDGVTLLNKPNKDLQKQVQSLEVSAMTLQYPGVKLSINAKDANNDLIEGLSAADFGILEDGEAMFATMESNQRTPRILIMSDTSLSMPAAFSGPNMTSFVDGLRDRILEKYPAAKLRYWKTPSYLFTWLLKASQTDNDIVIYVTDGHNSDTYNPENESIYRSGPPAIVLDVVNVEGYYAVKTFEKMAELTNGIHLPVADQDAAMTGIMEYVNQIDIKPYVFTYQSVGNTDLRHVEVGVDKKRITATTDYKFGMVDGADQIGPKIIGLYLKLKYANNREVKRIVAGWDYAVNPREIPSQNMANEVNDLMLGGMQLYFEGAGPTHSAALADLLTAKLSTRTWGEPLIDNDIAAAKTNFEKGQFNLSGDAMSLMLPLRNCATQQSLTIPGGLRIGLQTFKPGVITGVTSSLFDYLPTSNYVTLSENPKNGFETNVLKTAELAIREHQLYPTSTYSDLLETSWINIKKARETKWLYNLKIPDDKRYWNERVFRGASLRIFDVDAISKSFWNVNPQGELYGILPNASGGGGERFKAQLEEISAVINAYMALLGIAGVGGLSVGIVAQYGLTLVKLYAIVSEALIVMDTSGMDDAIAKELKGLACRVQKEIMFMAAGPLGKIMGSLDNLISQMGGKSPFGCN